MQKFYFNECLPAIADKNIFKGLFYSTLITFDGLVKKNSGIEKAVVTEKLPSSITIANVGTLYEIIDEIENKDLRNIAFSYFNRYPIEAHFDLDEHEANEILEKGYTLLIGDKEHDAINLAIVGYNKGFLFTTGTHEDVKKNILTPTAKNGTSKIDIFNLYGQQSVPEKPHNLQVNTLFIENEIIEAELSTQSLFNQLLGMLGDCVYSNSFERDFFKLREIEQQSIIDEFKKAKERNFATPFYPDTKIIKDVTPDHNPKCNVLELRIYTPTAIRVYFSETKGKVFVAKIGYKANPDQNADIKNAHLNLYKMIITS